MKTHTKILVLAATCFAFLSISRAQIVTYQTVSNYSGTSNYSIASDPTPLQQSNTAGQTFTNLYGISSLTYNFFGAPGVNTTLTAVFAKWNSGDQADPTNYSVVHNFGTFTVNQYTGVNQNGWSQITNGNGTFNTFAQQFSFSNLAEDVNVLTTWFETSPTATYALLLTNTTGSTTPFGLGFAANSFSYGAARVGVDSGSQDYTFSQIAVVTTNPVPESSTVAAILGCLLVAALVVFRIRQQRQLALAPVPTAA